MLFHCLKCSFKTANRSHLTEHEQTHRLDRRTCELCHRDYKTLKSLINHTRKYHSQTSAGVECLSRLQVSVCTALLYTSEILLHKGYTDTVTHLCTVHVFTTKQLQYFCSFVNVISFIVTTAKHQYLVCIITARLFNVMLLIVGNSAEHSTHFRFFDQLYTIAPG